MRTTKDRIRHTLLFELFILTMLVPGLSWLLNKPMHMMGGLSLCMGLLAMSINYIYNYAFDHALKHLGKPVYERSAALRGLHAVLFEVILFAISAPAIMYVLDYTFMQALLLDIGFMIAVPIYAFFFNIIYDRIFPISAPSTETVTS